MVLVIIGVLGVLAKDKEYVAQAQLNHNLAVIAGQKPKLAKAITNGVLGEHAKDKVFAAQVQLNLAA